MLQMTTPARKSQEELKQRLERLKQRPHLKNALKRLPGYGSLWVYRTREALPTEGETDGGMVTEVDTAQVTTFVKRLRTRPPPEKFPEEEGEVVQGPGFEFPTEKESAKCVKHWAKRFKKWTPSESLASTAPAAPRPMIRIKAPMPSNEVEVDGKRYRRVENREELQAQSALIEKCPVTLQDARFYRDLLKEQYGSVQCRFVTSTEGDVNGKGDLKEILAKNDVTAVYAPYAMASKVVLGMKKFLVAQAKPEMAAGLRVEVASKDDDPDEVTQKRRHDQHFTSPTQLDDGDQASVCM